MKKLICLIVTIAILTISNPLMAEEITKCKLPNGTIIGIALVTGQFSAAAIVGDTTFTVLKIHKKVKSLKNPDLPERDIGEVSLGYDKPAFFCPIHGVDPYETYVSNLGTDVALIFMDQCVE